MSYSNTGNLLVYIQNGGNNSIGFCSSMKQNLK